MNVQTRRLRSVVVLVGVAIGLPLASAGNLPIPKGEARTPETRTLTADEANQVLQRDWLFQAMGEPLAGAGGQGDRLGAGTGPAAVAPAAGPGPVGRPAGTRRPGTTLGGLREQPPAVPTVRSVETAPAWIWYPEGKPVEDAPAAARFFRCRFEVPAPRASGRVADRRGRRLRGVPERHSLGHARNLAADRGLRRRRALLKAGANVLAVRAENRPAPSKNPAGLIVRLVLTLADGKAAGRGLRRLVARRERTAAAVGAARA